MLKRLITTTLSLFVTTLYISQVFAIENFEKHTLQESNKENNIGIAAVVNGKVLTSKDLSDRAVIVAILNNISYSQAILMKEQLLRAMIDEKLLLHEGEKNGIMISDSKIDLIIDGIKEKQGINLKELEKTILLDSAKLNSIREQVKSQMILKELLDAHSTETNSIELVEASFLLPQLESQLLFAKAEHQRKHLKDRVNDKTEILLNEIILPINTSHDDVEKYISHIKHSDIKNLKQSIKYEIRNIGWIKINDLSDLYRSAIFDTILDKITQPLIGENVMIFLYVKEWKNLSNDNVREVSQLENTNEILKLVLLQEKKERWNQSILNQLRKKYLIEINKW